MSEILRPCPFCGESVELDYSELPHRKHWFITCECCGMMYQSSISQRKYVKVDWNNRPIEDALNKRIGVNLPPPTDEEKAKWILNYTRAMQQETAELIDSVPWKWWAKYQKFDEQNAKVEVVDLFHFLVSLAQTLGMTPDDVYQAYLKKNAVNHQRQESGYVKKDEADSKHI